MSWRKGIIIAVLILAVVAVLFSFGLAQAGNCGGGKGGGNSQTCPPRSPGGSSGLTCENIRLDLGGTNILCF
jgi:hypothetical protein